MGRRAGDGLVITDLKTGVASPEGADPPPDLRGLGPSAAPPFAPQPLPPEFSLLPSLLSPFYSFTLTTPTSHSNNLDSQHLQ